MPLRHLPFSLLPRRLVAVAALLVTCGSSAWGQRPVSRLDAMRDALAAGTRLALARADSSVASARLLTARTLPNPSLAASYSKSVPQKHLALEIPLDAPWSRRPRVRAASALAEAARLRLLSERDAVIVEVDTTYTQALAAEARFRLSRQTARDADSLRAMTAARRDAGDASDLDVDLATVSAGQQSNLASADSLTFMSVVLVLQSLMGVGADSVAIVLTDSLRPTMISQVAYTGRTTAGTPISLGAPSVLAAEASVRGAELALASQRRSVFALPALSVGVEYGDPTGGEPGLLPVFGVVLPLPLFDRNRGPIAEAKAERDRARAELVAVRLDVRRRLLEGERERNALLVRVARDSDLVVRAQRVATRSLTAYSEGASALPAVLEARRSAREVLAQYIDDLAALLTVEAELRALTRTVPAP